MHFNCSNISDMSKTKHLAVPRYDTCVCVFTVVVVVGCFWNSLEIESEVLCTFMLINNDEVIQFATHFKFHLYYSILTCNVNTIVSYIVMIESLEKTKLFENNELIRFFKN